MVEKPIEQRTFIGLHIPKCAGTTLLNRVRSNIPPDRVFQNTKVMLNYRQGKEDFLHIRAKRRLRFVWGHTIHEEMLKFFSPQPILITGLREPIARFRSELQYMVKVAERQQRPRPEIEQHIESVRNPICRFLIKRFPTFAGEVGTPAERAIKVIDAFHYVYFSETFEETAGAIFKAMGIEPGVINSNVSPESRRQEASGDNFDINVEHHKYDIAVYAHARARFSDLPPEEAFRCENEILLKFLLTPKKKKILRDFMWTSAFHAYKNWEALPRVLKEKKKQIEELEYEVMFYRRMLESKSVSPQE